MNLKQKPGPPTKMVYRDHKEAVFIHIVLAAVSAFFLGSFLLTAQEMGLKLKDYCWSTDLDAYGFVAPQAGDPAAHMSLGRGLTFTDDNTLVAYLVVRQPSEELQRRSHPGPSDPYQLHAVFLDATVGNVKAQERWPTQGVDRSSISGTRESRFIIRKPGSVSLYSPDRKELAEVQLPTIGTEASDFWRVEVSPSGKFLWLIHNIGVEKSHVMRLDASTFRTLDEWDEPEYGPGTAGEDTIVREEHPGPSQPGTNLRLRTSQTPWREVARNVTPDIFINNSTILVRYSGGIAAIDTSGKLLFQDRNPEGNVLLNYDVERPVVSRDGSRLAMMGVRYKHGFFAVSHPTAARILVYDVPTWKRLAVVDVLPSPKFHVAFAISPNGSLLATLSDSTVRVYQLPSPGR